MSASDYVVLRGGNSVPVPVLRRLWALEERGVQFRLDDDEVIVGPSKLLTDGDRAFLHESKPLLLTILAGDVGLVA